MVEEASDAGEVRAEGETGRNILGIRTPLFTTVKDGSWRVERLGIPISTRLGIEIDLDRAAGSELRSCNCLQTPARTSHPYTVQDSRGFTSEWKPQNEGRE